jgi:hypothetical protein
MKRLVFTSLLVAQLAACGKKSEPRVEKAKEPVKTAEPAPAKLDRIARGDFNRGAVRQNLPVYWIADKDKDGAIDVDEVASLRFYPSVSIWVDSGKLTPEFMAAYEQIVAAAAAKPVGTAEEIARRELVGQDLDGGRATLVYNDLRGLPDDHKVMVRHIAGAAVKIDALYEKMSGAAALAKQVPADDPASQSLFRRNRGPKCVTPKVEKNEACTAIPGAPKALVEVYPAELQSDAGFCKALEARKDAKALLEPFTVVKKDGDKLVAVPYSEAYKNEMIAIAGDLSSAADALKDANEEPLRVYLRAAAKAFTDNDWKPADEAWAKMSATNSKWYLRIAPDETYWEPCAYKAGFHVSFALINQGSLAWQDKLAPVQQDMEKLMAGVAGAPYKERKVSFHLPDFIDIVMNAGDSRNPLGATIGQSLPNVGPVAEESRGRTVAMSNLYADVDSIGARHQQASSMLDAESMKAYAESPEPGLVSTILHEACHNLGPSHDYKARGKTDGEAFGGPIASVMEELKAQTCGIYLVEFLRGKGILSDELARRVYIDTVVWAMGHVSQGMYTGDGDRKAYSQLAAIQLGIFIQEGALTWNPDATADNGKDKGAFTVHFDKLVPTIEKMIKTVAGIKARADKPGADKLIKDFVDGDVVPKATIAERFLRFPKASFVYAYDL